MIQAKRGLARAVPADDQHPLPGLDSEIDAAQGRLGPRRAGAVGVGDAA